MIASNKTTPQGFSIIELLVSMAIFSVILLLFSQMTSSTMTSWLRMSDRQIQFQESKAAFDVISSRLSSAELSPYWGFNYPDGDTSRSPIGYDLLSDLHFVIGGGSSGNSSTPALLPEGVMAPTHAVFFHGSFGLSEDVAMRGFGSLLNAWGYFVEFGSNQDDLAGFLTSEANIKPKNRFRLMELQLPSEELTTFRNDSGSDDRVLDIDEATSADQLFAWFRSGVTAGRAIPLSDNIIALVITPLPAETAGDTQYDPASLAPDYYYDSRANQYSSSPVSDELADLTEHRLPPLVRVTMVAISEQSALELADENGDSAPDLGISQLFQKVDDYDNDIQILEQKLQEMRVNYRVFTNTIRLRNARWNQKN